MLTNYSAPCITNRLSGFVRIRDFTSDLGRGPNMRLPTGPNGYEVTLYTYMHLYVCVYIYIYRQIDRWIDG